MNKRKLAIIGLGVAALVGLTIAGTAAAAPPTTPGTGATNQSDWNCPMGGPHGHMYAYSTAVTNTLGLTPAEIEAQLAQGKSLVEIAATKSVTEDQLVQAILAQAKANLEQAVQAGYLNQEQATQQLTWLEQFIRQAVNNKDGYNYGGMAGGGMMSGGMMSGGMMRGGMMQGMMGGGMMSGGMMGGWGRTF
ncbi:MAG: hypothetical protein HYX81_01615 [Chloroflexi bacterium]|nr:hypothetical protein [Chloroflexota bacterium]